MSMGTQYNLKSPGVKRLMREALELANPTEEYYACPLEDNLFEWHFTVRGPPETEFEGGYYHGRILLPPQYPMQPPNIILLTELQPVLWELALAICLVCDAWEYGLFKMHAFPANLSRSRIWQERLGLKYTREPFKNRRITYAPNGRFEVNKKICLSISGYHPETWQPSWSIRTALLALIAFMPTKGVGTIGSLDYTPEERQVLARKSKGWECSTCGKIADKLISAGNAASPALTQEESSMLQNIALKAEEDANRKDVNTELGDPKSEEKPPDDQTPDSKNEEVVKPKGRAVPFPEKDGSEQTKPDDLRQRNVPSTSGVTEVQNEITDEILRASIERSKRDKYWTSVIYVIVALIVLLIIRRIFFL